MDQQKAVPYPKAAAKLDGESTSTPGSRSLGKSKHNLCGQVHNAGIQILPYSSYGPINVIPLCLGLSVFKRQNEIYSMA